jgi:hypothetical protein
MRHLRSARGLTARAERLLMPGGPRTGAPGRRGAASPGRPAGQQGHRQAQTQTQTQHRFQRPWAGQRWRSTIEGRRQTDAQMPNFTQGHCRESQTGSNGVAARRKRLRCDARMGHSGTQLDFLNWFPHPRRADLGDSVCTDAGRTDRGFHMALSGEMAGQWLFRWVGIGSL